MKFNAEIKINGSAEKAWEVLGLGYGEICQWTSSLSESSMDGELAAGGTRSCTSSKSFGPFKSGLIVQERLTLFDRENKVFAYEALPNTLPFFVREARNKWSIIPVDEGNCLVRTEASVRFAGILNWFAPLFKSMMTKDFYTLVEELQYRIEYGEPHPEVIKFKAQNNQMVAQKG